MELAERLDRLWAAIIDHALVAAVAVAAALAYAGARGSASLGLILGSCGAAMIALLAVQVWLLTTRGQTVGKRALGLRIVKASDMTNGGFVTNVLLRAGAAWAISMVPVAGTIFAVADPLFIFRDDRRCLHDQIAGTCVIKA